MAAAPQAIGWWKSKARVTRAARARATSTPTLKEGIGSLGAGGRPSRVHEPCFALDGKAEAGTGSAHALRYLDLRRSERQKKFVLATAVVQEVRKSIFMSEVHRRRNTPPLTSRTPRERGTTCCPSRASKRGATYALPSVSPNFFQAELRMVRASRLHPDRPPLPIRCFR